MSLPERLRDAELPGEDEARERARRVVHAAFAEREPAPAGRPALRFRRLPALVAGCVALVLLAFSPPGQALSDWVRQRFDPPAKPRPKPRPTLDALPAPGSLLVDSPAGSWVVRRDGSKRLLGPYSDPSWSPGGLFVVAARPGGLVAVEPGGRVRWTLARTRVSQPRWAPSGFRIAYRSGREVRVVAGDGTGDRLLRAGTLAEWRPGGHVNVVAVADRRGAVRVVDVDTRRTLWRTSSKVARPLQLAWSADGRRLAVLSRRSLSVFAAGGARVMRRALPAATGAPAMAYSPQGRALALVRDRDGAGELALVDRGRSRLVFAGRGQLAGVTWSHDGGWLLTTRPGADQWAFVRARGGSRVETVSGVGREFDPRASGAAGQPLPRDWCCSR